MQPVTRSHTPRNTTITARDLRESIPPLETSTYLNFGAHGPSPIEVQEAASAIVSRQETASVDPGAYEVAHEARESARSTVASFIGADADAVALTHSTTDGINRFATAIDWEPGDVVVRTDLEHPAGILPWHRLEEYGVEVRVIETRNGRIEPDTFASAVADATLVCFSALSWTYGTVQPVAELASIASEAGTYTLVDAVQVPGQQPFDVTDWGADAVAAAGHKWLLGPWGSGFLYVDTDTANELTPGSVGYLSVTDPNATALTYAQGARRFELGTRSPAPHRGLEVAIDRIDAIGIDSMQDRISDLTERLTDGLNADQILSPVPAESGLVTYAVSDPEATVERLAADNIVIRSLSTPNAIRISVHAVTSEGDIDTVVSALTDQSPEAFRHFET